MGRMELNICMSDKHHRYYKHTKCHQNLRGDPKFLVDLTWYDPYTTIVVVSGLLTYMLVILSVPVFTAVLKSFAACYAIKDIKEINMRESGEHKLTIVLFILYYYISTLLKPTIFILH